jgi:hypothetical protein
MKGNNQYFLCAISLFVAAHTVGCAEYLDRKDTVASGAGNAVRANVTTQVIDPWPRLAGNTRLALDGERMQRAIERYQTNRVTDPGCAQLDERGKPPATSNGTPCAEAPPSPSLPRRGGTLVPKPASGTGSP